MRKTVKTSTNKKQQPKKTKTTMTALTSTKKDEKIYIDQITSSSAFLKQRSKEEQPTGATKESEEVGPYDILCGRDKLAFNNIGNRRFRVTMNLNMPRYLQATTRYEKSTVIISIVRMLRDEVGARFLKKKGKIYVEIDEKEARSKVGHALRDMRVAQEESAVKSTTAKMKDKKSCSNNNNKKNHEASRQQRRLLETKHHDPTDLDVDLREKNAEGEDSDLQESLESIESIFSDVDEEDDTSQSLLESYVLLLTPDRHVSGVAVVETNLSRGIFTPGTNVGNDPAELGAVKDLEMEWTIDSDDDNS